MIDHSFDIANAHGLIAYCFGEPKQVHCHARLITIRAIADGQTAGTWRFGTGGHDPGGFCQRGGHPDARDFRVDVFGKGWKSTPLSPNSDGSYTAKVKKPKKGFTAFFVELTYQTSGKNTFKFTTGTNVIPDIKPFAKENTSDKGMAAVTALP